MHEPRSMDEPCLCGGAIHVVRPTDHEAITVAVKTHNATAQHRIWAVQQGSVVPSPYEEVGLPGRTTIAPRHEPALARPAAEENTMSVTSDYLHDAGVPPRFHESSLDAFHPTRSSGGLKALAWARSIAAEAHSGLLCGDVGTGKTHLVVGILAARHAAWLEKYPQANIDVKDDRGRVVGVRGRPNLSDAFVDVPAMLDRMRSWIAHPDGPDPIWDLKRADLLVLDDLGRERVTDWASERLYVIVDYRYGQRLPTIATSNLKPSELVSGDYGPIVSRLLDGSQAIWLGGKDQRTA